MSKTKILMVCLGNICRSPLAEGILKSKLDPMRYEVDSAGTGSWHIGNKPDHRSIAVALNHQIDLNSLRGRQFSEEDFQNFDFIYVMDNANYKDVIALAPDDASKNKVDLILNVLFPNENVDVPDPYYGNMMDFQKVFDMLNQACDVIKLKLENIDKG